MTKKLKRESPLYSVRLFDYGVTSGHFRGTGVCSEDIVTYADPFVLARRILKLDEMREEGYTRAEIYELNDGELFRGVVRVGRRTRDRYRVLGALRRGVWNPGLRNLVRDLKLRPSVLASLGRSL